MKHYMMEDRNAQRPYSETGGLDGIRDMNLLDSSVNSPYHTFGGQNLYPTVQATAVHCGLKSVAFSLVKNHPFLDGNKRIGMLAMLVFLDVNSIPVHCSNEELTKLGLGLAEGSIDEAVVIDWIVERS
ncbi:death-on-curing protein [Spirochaetia bacterium]|nr:death-on-curing protein [Spirochaetia bacterium]